MLRHFAWIVSALSLAVASAACGRGSDASRDPQGGDGIPEDAAPCREPAHWPYAIRSTKFAFLVHAHSADELGVARTVIDQLDAAWEFETQHLGFEAPLSDKGQCGPDADFDVFLWRGSNTCYVQVIHPFPEEKYLFEPEAPWGGRATYMVVDPWGKYGGDILGQTIAHELNHASHAVEDWYEAGAVFEMTATYVEQYFGDALAYNVHDFQQHPDWSVLWYDDYRTYSMYGSALYLYFLRDYYFTPGGVLDPTFAARLWRAARNDPRRPLVNRPNVVDAFDALLGGFGASYVDSIVPFARWRYYTGSNDDGRHFQPWKDVPTVMALLPTVQDPAHPANVKLDASLTSNSTSHALDPPLMLTGSSYLEVLPDPPDRTSFRLSVSASIDPRVRWVVQAVPGLVHGSDGEVVDLSSGSARVFFATSGGSARRVLIVTALPNGPLDPDDRSGERFPLTLHLDP